MRDGNIDRDGNGNTRFDVNRWHGQRLAREEANRRRTHPPEYLEYRATSAGTAAIVLLACAFLFMLLVVGARLAKAWGYL